MKQKQTTQGGRNGFLGMMESAYKSTSEEEEEELLQPPVQALSGFQRQLEASEYGGSQITVQSAIGSHKGISRIELLAMLKKRLAAVKKERKELLVIFYETLILDMERTLGIARQNSTLTIQRSVGFRSMLDAATHGSTETERNLDTPNALNSAEGFLGMAEVAFGGQREEEKVKVLRIGDKIRVARGFFDQYEMVMTPKGIVRHFKE